MISMGIHVAGGSDAPIEKPNPFEGLHAAIFRHDRNGKQRGGGRRVSSITSVARFS